MHNHELKIAFENIVLSSLMMYVKSSKNSETSTNCLNSPLREEKERRQGQRGEGIVDD